MGVIISKITKPVRAWNIENRAQRIINRDKPIPAPRRASTEEQLKQADEVDPDFLANHYKKDEDLLNRLKQVFVSSNIRVDINEEDKSEKLPHRRTWSEGFEYGFWEPKEIPEGRCYLRQAMQFMSDHMSQPDKHTVESISLEYKLDSKDVANILEYYRVYQVIIPGKDSGRMYVPKYEVKGEIADK